ncbi:hypothetical protein K490DRAFT_46310 [Saccharata proteae CBS 121410]|uniref:HCP-like protein n=1 Tax=Saccharata proteae CBS 121410 TaxID=1314787 RepID=A0A9P4HRZ3_9PEZI|nr:hypothetical protein K490DRAFT_46310 [Saccharata proteae CBS 121410]
MDLPSPRTGEIPPALSPLDAFAMHSRLLAKRFEENKNGKRISRLPPLAIANEFGRHRPGYLRSKSAGDPNADGTSPGSSEGDHTPLSAKEVKPDKRPMSQHPMIYQDDSFTGPATSFHNRLSPLRETGRTPPPQKAQDYFAIPRAQSPEPMESNIETRVEEATPMTPQSRKQSMDQVPEPITRNQRNLTIDSVASQGRSPRSLKPPRSPGLARSPRVSPSIRSVPGDSSDADEPMSMGGSFDSLPPRQLSSNTSYSRSHSPASPLPQSIQRSPSVASDRSLGGTGLQRPPAFNFSRPMSRASRPPSLDARPSLDVPSRQGSGESAYMRPSLDIPSRQNSGDNTFTFNQTVHTPVSMMSEDYMSGEENHNHPAPSYIYSKYNLPRGRMLQRNLAGRQEFVGTQWENAAPRTTAERPPSPPSPPRTEPQSSPPNAHGARPSSAGTGATGATTRIADLSPQQHLEKGIEFHESGQVQKSTYHLRLAARAGVPTAMLLYALACRHGWGMRPNQHEGVQWLRKAVDSAQLEVADDEDLTKKGQPGDVLATKTHKAQFALSIYELGVSYMNGWGIQQDKSLALRCFEIAGNWGDADALAEAGFCYTEGIGCKKDLKKAAKFYRAAEAKGMSMAGNSWIYKDKYMDNDGDSRGRSASKANGAASEKKTRDKSRTRTIFSRKKSLAA